MIEKEVRCGFSDEMPVTGKKSSCCHGDGAFLSYSAEVMNYAGGALRKEREI